MRLRVRVRVRVWGGLREVFLDWFLFLLSSNFSPSLVNTFDKGAAYLSVNKSMKSSLAVPCVASPLAFCNTQTRQVRWQNHQGLRGTCHGNAQPTICRPCSLGPL